MSENENELVTIEIKDHVADVRFNRPDKYNALSPGMFKAIEKAALDLHEDRSVRAVVLSGNGKGFCAGLDLMNFQNMNQGASVGSGLDNKEKKYPNMFQAVGYLWKQLPVPVIAALHGVAFGGGFQIAMGADIRIADPSTRLSVMEIKWGLIPDMSASQTLRDLVRIDVAKELTYTGRIVEAPEAAELGLVTKISEDPLTDALEMAKVIASKSPDATSRAKQLFNESWHGDSIAGLQLEEKLQKEIIGQKNQIEAIMSNMEKRPAKYDDRS